MAVSPCGERDMQATPFGRDELIHEVASEIKKGKHLVLTGAIGVGKSSVLRESLKHIERRVSERRHFNPLTESQPLPVEDQRQCRRRQRQQVLVYITEHQAKAQFVQMAKRLLETGVLRPSALGLAKKFDTIPTEELDWTELRRTVNRASLRDVSGSIISAIYAYEGKVVIAVDDMTNLTPTQQAFWLAIFEHAQVIACASDRKHGLRKLWWKMKVIEVPALKPESAIALVRDYIAKQGMMIESPDLYVAHVVKQANGNPQAMMDMLSESAKEKRVNKQQIRAMRHAAGVSYLDFTPVMILFGAGIVSTRYLAMGIGDTALYILAGIGAALFLAIRFLFMKGAGKASG
jgi:energy-coupling factor transporter ATP-binding protein EcfA2